MAIDIDGVVHMGALSISTPWNTPGKTPTSAFEPARPALVWKLDHSFNVVDLYGLGVDYTKNTGFPTDIDVDEANDLLFIYNQGVTSVGGDRVIAIDMTDGSVVWSYDPGTANVGGGQVRVSGNHVYVSGAANSNWDGVGATTVTPSTPSTNLASMWKLDKLDGSLVAALNGAAAGSLRGFVIGGNNIYVARRGGGAHKISTSFSIVWTTQIFEGPPFEPAMLCWDPGLDLTNSRVHFGTVQQDVFSPPPGTDEAAIGELNTSTGAIIAYVKFASGGGIDRPIIRGIYADGSYIYVCGQAGSDECPGVVKFDTSWNAIWGWDIREMDLPSLKKNFCTRITKHGSSVFVVGDASSTYTGNTGADPRANLFKLADSDGSVEAVGCVGRHQLYSLKVTDDYIYVGSMYPTHVSNNGPLHEDYVRRPGRMNFGGTTFLGNPPAYTKSVDSAGRVLTFDMLSPSALLSGLSAGIPWSWSVSEACSWISVSPTSGDSEDAFPLEISVTIAENFGAERQCVLTFTAVETVDDSPFTITIIQAAP